MGGLAVAAVMLLRAVGWASVCTPGRQVLEPAVQPPRCLPLTLLSAGEEALSEEPPEGMFKPVAEPNQLDNMLLSNQMASYCQHINSATQQALSKLTLMEGLQKAL